MGQTFTGMLRQCFAWPAQGISPEKNDFLAAAATEVDIMAIVGLLLLLSAAGLTLDVVWQNTASIGVDAIRQGLTVNSGWLFAAGVATGTVGLLGLSMLVGGMARARRRRVALTEARSTVEDLQADRDRWAAQLDRERAGRNSTGSDRGQAVVDLADDDRKPASASAGGHGLLHRRSP